MSPFTARPPSKNGLFHFSGGITYRGFFNFSNIIKFKLCISIIDYFSQGGPRKEVTPPLASFLENLQK